MRRRARREYAELARSQANLLMSSIAMAVRGDRDPAVRATESLQDGTRCPEAGPGKTPLLGPVDERPPVPCRTEPVLENERSIHPPYTGVGSSHRTEARPQRHRLHRLHRLHRSLKRTN